MAIETNALLSEIKVKFFDMEKLMLQGILATRNKLTKYLDEKTAPPSSRKLEQGHVWK